jgi:hypothetical protein
MTTNHLKTGVEPTPETSYISIPQTTSNIIFETYNESTTVTNEIFSGYQPREMAGWGIKMFVVQVRTGNVWFFGH